jgi:hypothetical protein
MHLQQIGRVMRACDGKAGATVLDHAGNHHRHGLVTQRLVYSLADKVAVAQQRGSGEKPESFRRCPECFLLMAPGTPVCEGCGHVFQSEVPEEQHGELVQIGRTVPFPERLRFWLAAEQRRIDYGYREGYSAVQYKNRYGTWPQLVGGQLVERMPTSDELPVSGDDERKREAYLELLRAARAAGRKDGFAFHAYVRKFGEKPPWKWRQSA